MEPKTMIITTRGATFRAVDEATNYARRRANETRRAYLVSAMGHVMVDNASNRALLNDLGGLAERVEPEV